MVQSREAGDSLSPDDYLWPMTTIRDTLLRPDVERHIPRGKLKPLLQWHLSRLQKPWAPFKPASEASRKALAGTTVTIPESTPAAKLDVDAGPRSISLRLSDETGLDEITAFLLWKSYALHSVDDPVPAPGQSEEDALFEHLLGWYEQELVAVPQIVMALHFGASEGFEDIQKEILGNQASYIEELFKAFAMLAQKEITEKRLKGGLFWATLQLRQQETLLDLLFLILYQFTTRPAAVSEGLVKGAVMSLFGTRQANREVWGEDAECARLSTRVRDLVLLISVESLCLAQIVSPEGDDEDNTFGATLLHSRDSIHAVHQFIAENSQDLEAPEFEIGAREFEMPQWPMAILCLGWAIVLRSLPPNLQPPTGDYFHLDTSDMDSAEIMSFINIANRALRISSGLFPWLEAVLQGPLYETTKDAFNGDLADDMAALRRSPFKDLLIGLSDLVRIDNIQDKYGLYRSWSHLFGGGTRQASTSLSANYWSVDYVFDDRRAILDQSQFPREATSLPTLLAALTGVSSDDEVVLGDTTSTVTDVYQYFCGLPYVTFVAPPGTYDFDDGSDGIHTVVATSDLELPGGYIIPRRTPGIAHSDDGDDEMIVSWRFRQPAWPLLLEILRGVAGLGGKQPSRPGMRRVTLGEMGLLGDLPAILASGLKLLSCVLRSPDAAAHLAGVDHGAIGRSILELALNVASKRDDPTAAKYAIDILQSLLLTGASDIWQFFRASGFFDSASRRVGSVASLIQNDALRGEHGLTVALLRLVRSLVSANAGDSLVVRSAVKLVYGEVWSKFSGWRYRDVSKRYEIAALLLQIFDSVLRHPLSEDTSSPSAPAAYLIDLFVKVASPLTYKPLVDVLTQSTALVTKLIQSRRWSDAQAVAFTFDCGASFLSTLVRLAPSLNVQAGALPYSIFSSTVVLPGGDRIQLADRLFDLIADPALQTTSLRLVIRLVRVWLMTTNAPQRPSLAGMLRRADASIGKLADLAFTSAADDVKPDAWALLGTIIRTQPGCATFCIGTPKDDKLTGPLKMAVDEIGEWRSLMNDAPRALAAVLGYLQAVLDSSSASKAVSALRKDNAFWQAVYDVSIKNVPKPSALAEDVPSRVQDYCYAVQAKANASGLLAAELALVLEGDLPETKALSLVLSLFRNTSALEDVGTQAVRTTCDPELHAAQATALHDEGIQIVRLRTIALPEERDYGRSYLYDGPPVILNDSEKQASLDASLAMLNLNWSQLDADVNLTKAWRLLAEIASEWTNGDPLCAKSALRAAAVVSHELAEEDRGGDVMLAIQTERLAILAVLLDVALSPDVESEADVVKELAKSVRAIVESPLFNPIVSLRHPELPPIHRPVLRTLLLLSQAQAGSADDTIREVLFDAGASFALDAADCILDWICRERSPLSELDLGLVVALLCQMSSTSSVGVWLDKLMQVNLIPRSLELIVRTRPVDGVLPSHFHTILLLHLAIANTTATAEKLAGSGILQAYSDNVVAVAAEAASIDATPGNESLHRAWCGMLLVVKALLASLASTTFGKMDVVPWVRVVLPQMLSVLEWGETPLSRPVLEEMAGVVDVFYGLADQDLLNEFAPSALTLLSGVRYALSHPHRFATLVVPDSEEQQAELEKELEKIESNADNVNLVATETPVVRTATLKLVDLTRSLLATLVKFTKAFDVLDGRVEANADLLLPYDDDALVSASSDPIGIINEVYLLLRGVADKLGPATSPDARAANQACEAAALLAVTQLTARRALGSPAAGRTREMDVDSLSEKRSRRASTSADSRSDGVLRELQGDVRSMLPAGGGLTGFLRGIVDVEFGDA